MAGKNREDPDDPKDISKGHTFPISTGAASGVASVTGPVAIAAGQNVGAEVTLTLNIPIMYNFELTAGCEVTVGFTLPNTFKSFGTMSGPGGLPWVADKTKVVGVLYQSGSKVADFASIAEAADTSAVKCTEAGTTDCDFTVTMKYAAAPVTIAAGAHIQV